MSDQFTGEPVRGEVVERHEVVEPSLDPVGRTGTVVVSPYYYRSIRFIWFLAGLVDVLIGLRFALKLFGASTLSPFVLLIDGVTAPLVAPFRGIFPVSGQGPFIFEPASLVALLIYPLIALALVSIIRIMGNRRAPAA
jgi:hypothetical protein